MACLLRFEREQDRIECNSKQCDHAGAISANLSQEDQTTSLVIVRSEALYPCCGSRDQIGESNTPFRKSIIFSIAHSFRNQLRLIQQLPEPIGMAGVMMAEGGGPKSWIDADKQNTQIRSKVIR